MKRAHMTCSMPIVLQTAVFFFALLACVCVPLMTQASSVVFQPPVVTVASGQTFSLPLFVDPADEKNYTVRLALNFPTTTLEVVSFTFAPSWMALSQPGYDLVDNTNGELIKTAGFPSGFSSSELFGTITFRAKQSGDVAVTVGVRSFVLDANGDSTLQARSQARVVVRDVSVVPAVVLAPQTTSSSSSTIATLEPLPDLPPPKEANLFDVSISPQVETTGVGLISKVAPGEFLPFSVKLLNFGSNNAVDVTVMYHITDMSGRVIYTAQETVAVETTATFVKTIQIPFGTLPGQYIAKSSIVYAGQIAPAVTEFTFTVERKILGLFQGSFLLYGGSVLIVGLCMLWIGRLLVKRRRKVRFTPFDYSDIPHDQRTFYEILSDTIMEMRERVGDDALDIAAHIDGLSIDLETGRVLSLSEHPSKIIATLVSEYEKLLGKKVSFSLRR